MDTPDEPLLFGTLVPTSETDSKSESVPLALWLMVGAILFAFLWPAWTMTADVRVVHLPPQLSSSAEKQNLQIRLKLHQDMRQLNNTIQQVSK